MLKRSIPWTFQPPPGVGPNPYWIKKGLVALFDVRQARELISGDFATNKASLLPAVPTSKGLAADFSGTINQQYTHRAAYAVTGAITIAAYIEVDTLTNYTPIISKGSSPTSNVPYELRIGQSATSGDVDLIRAKAFDVREQYAPSSVVSAGFKGLLVVSSPNGLVETTPTLTANGVKTSLSSTLQSGTTGPCVDAGAAVWIARRSDGATQFDGRMYYIPLFNVALSDEDKKYLLDNPWSIYAPQQRNNYVNVSGGTTHICTSSLIGSGAIVAGTSIHAVKHDCNGVLTGVGASTNGVSKRYPKHASSGVIVGTGALTSGVVNRVGAATTHACTGYLTGVGASISGSSKKYFRHVCNSTLIGQGASTVGVARQVKKHVATGTMVGQGGVINGLAARPFTLVLPLTPLQANGDLVNSEWLTRQLLALGGNMQVNVGAMSDFDSVNRESIDVNKSPADTNGASVDKEDLFRKLK